MRWPWRFIFPACGLALFLIGTYQGFHFTRQVYRNHPARYFYWGTVRLDSDPLNRHPLPRTVTPCSGGEENCVEFEPDFIWVEPGLGEKAFILSALPAFAISSLSILVLRRFGISEVITFLVSMPPLIVAWFYALGWLLDRWRRKRACRQVAG
jgi:hypothetical protein